MGQEHEAGKAVTVVVVKERRSGIRMASAVPREAASIFVAKHIFMLFARNEVRIWGHHGPSDQAESIRIRLSEVWKLRAADGGGKYIIENSKR